MHSELTYSATVSAVITRADGTVEDLGVIAATSTDPEIQALYDLLVAEAEQAIAAANLRSNG